MKRFHLTALTLLMILGPSFGQISVLRQISYAFPLDSIEKAKLELCKEYSIYHRYDHYRKTKKIFYGGTFVGAKINYVPPPNNFSSFYLSENGNAIATSKELVDSLFLKAFMDSSFAIKNSEIPIFYMLFTRSGYIVNDSKDLLSFQKNIKDDFDSYRVNETDTVSTNANIETTTIYAYNRDFRNIYKYIFYHDKQGKWIRTPEKSIIFKEVGPYNYWR